MKNFDESLIDADQTSWLEMWKRCDEAYHHCYSHFSKSFKTWYEADRFHDSVLKGVNTFSNPKGEWGVEIFLDYFVTSEKKSGVLKYSGVSWFQIRKETETYYHPNWHEECLYGEFYQSERNNLKVVHEFFTAEDTYFYVEFKKLTFEEVIEHSAKDNQKKR